MSIKIALAGNPNCGKTTMFNGLTSSKQYVGNWPGVTVEKKEGKYKKDKSIIIQDLPGIYSLSPYTEEEVIARNYLVKDKPDVIINIIDGTNLERNLYLTVQLLELGLPMVIALNMTDIIKKNGEIIDCEKLSRSLGCKVIETSALKGIGLEKVIKAAKETIGIKTEFPKVFAGETLDRINIIKDIIKGYVDPNFINWYAVKVFEKDIKINEEIKFSTNTKKKINKLVDDSEKHFEEGTESVVTNARYNFIKQIVTKAFIKKNKPKLTTSDKIDKVVTNRILALPIFAIVMFLVYYISISSIGAILTEWTNDTLFGTFIIENLTNYFSNIGMAVWMNSLICNGIIGGVGAILGFVPQLLVLFILLSLLEDIGYLSRVAFIMDKIFRKFGLSGKSFIPLLIGSGCSIPGIMASRTIENEKDRRITVMTTSFIPCGAKMPIIALFAGAMFSNAWYVGPLCYFIGVFSVLISGIVLKKTKPFAGEPAPFVMELPDYHRPMAKNIFSNTYERAAAFVKKAGSIILIATIAIWFFSSFGIVEGNFILVDDIGLSILAWIGNLFKWFFAPLGFGNWKATVATVMGLVAKEEVVGVLGVLYQLSGAAMDAVIKQNFNNMQAWSFILFNLLSIPCFAAIGTIKNEMNNKKWTWLTLAYLTVFAYTWVFSFYHIACLFAYGNFGFSTVLGFVILIIWLHLIFRKNKYREG